MTRSFSAPCRDRLMVARNLLATAQAAPLIDAIQTAGIEVLLYKGAALLALDLVPPSRPMADIDVLVRAHDRHRAEAILLERGLFIPKAAARPVTLRETGPGSLCTPQGTQIDLSSSLSRHRLWPIDYRALFAGAVDLRFGGITTRRPSNEDLIVTIAIDRAKDAFFSGATGIADLAAVTAQLAIDWQRVVDRAIQWKCTIAVWVALSQAIRVGGAPVPAWVMGALCPDRVRRAYLHRILDTAAVPAYRFRHPARLRQLVGGLALVDDPRSYLAAVRRFAGLRVRDFWAAHASPPRQVSNRDHRPQPARSRA